MRDQVRVVAFQHGEKPIVRVRSYSDGTPGIVIHLAMSGLDLSLHMDSEMDALTVADLITDEIAEWATRPPLDAKPDTDPFVATK